MSECFYCRVLLGTSSLLHPSHKCSVCKERTLGSVFAYASSTRIGGTKFENLRQLAALVSIEGDWKNISPQTALEVMNTRTSRDQISSNAITRAYKEGLCIHAADEGKAYDIHGVYFGGENEAMNDSVSRAIARVPVKNTKTPCVALVPMESVLRKCEGSFKEMSMISYKDMVGLEKELDVMRKNGKFPNGLFILFQSNFVKEFVMKINEFCEKVWKNVCTTFYLSPDVLPLNASVE